MRELVFHSAEERKKKKAEEATQELARKKAPLLYEKARLEKMLAPDAGPLFRTLVQSQLDRIKEELKLIDGVATE